MRCFSTPEGGVLVEWAAEQTGVLKPDRTPLGRAWTFWLLDGGEVARTWTPVASSLQEVLTTIAHAIEGDELVAYSHEVTFGADGPRDTALARNVELQGLRHLPAADAPSEEEVRRAIDRREAARRAAWAEHERRERERLARFERSLPSLAPGESIGLVWRYEGPEVVVASASGDEIWREPDWPWLGKELYRRLGRVAREKYGDGLVAFDVDVPDEEYLRFDYD